MPNSAGVLLTRMKSLDYDPRKGSTRRNAIITAACTLLLGGAFWYSITTTLDDMTQRDCNAGIQKACQALK